MPEAFQLYRQLDDRKAFTQFFDCKNPMMGLPTAIHEGVHAYNFQVNGYAMLPMPGRTQAVLPRSPLTERMPAPGKVLAGRKWPGVEPAFVTTYLKPGAASSAQDFTYLLDELNAYTWDLHSALILKDVRSLQIGTWEIHHRDGLLALVEFTVAYVAAVGRMEPEVEALTRALLTQAGSVINASCDVPKFGRACPRVGS